MLLMKAVSVVVISSRIIVLRFTSLVMLFLSSACMLAQLSFDKNVFKYISMRSACCIISSLLLIGKHVVCQLGFHQNENWLF